MPTDYIYLPLCRSNPGLRDLHVEAPGTWWRAVCWTSSSVPTLVFEQYQLERETPKGYWVKKVGEWCCVDPVWRRRDSRDLAKTKFEALNNLLRRKHGHVQHARGRLEDAELQLRSVDGVVTLLREWKLTEPSVQEPPPCH
jgi:hypothetical protein